MIKNVAKAPFPYFGGKSKAAHTVWRLLGDVHSYVEPFCGSLAVLLGRPHEANRTYYSETVNDADGLLVNAWRSIQLRPDETAEAASWPVTEADLTARHLAIVRWARERELERLLADPSWCDPVIGGWWIWGLSSWIGSGWCSGTGPWTERDGRLIKQPRGAPQAREPGVSRQRPILVHGGQGVNAPQAREPGVKRKLPHVYDNGRGVNAPQAREPGVDRKRPHLGDDGMGVNHAGTREPGVSRQLPVLSGNGQGVNHPGTREPGVEYHPRTMPEVRRWFAYLSARLRHVRVINGDWSRAVTPSVVKTLSVRNGKGVAGVFLDPPYADTASRAEGLYTVDSLDVAHAVREWALANGDDPRVRIVVAGFAGEHGDDFARAGWREVSWFRGGYLQGGYGQQGARGHQQDRERLWASPSCLPLDDADVDDAEAATDDVNADDVNADDVNADDVLPGQGSLF